MTMRPAYVHFAFSVLVLLASVSIARPVLQPVPRDAVLQLHGSSGLPVDVSTATARHPVLRPKPVQDAGVYTSTRTAKAEIGRADFRSSSASGKFGVLCSDDANYASACSQYGNQYCDPKWVFSDGPSYRDACRSTCGNCGGDNNGAEWRAELLNLVNDVRRSYGLSEVCYNSKLNDAAQRYSETMNNNNWFDHTGPDGSSAGNRINGAGYSWNTYGENIARGQGSARDVFNSWWNSQGHRDNILGNGFSHMGAGWVQGSNYWTQIFAASGSEGCS